MSNPHIITKAKRLLPIIAKELCLELDNDSEAVAIIAMTIAHTQNTERREDLSNDMIRMIEKSWSTE